MLSCVNALVGELTNDMVGVAVSLRGHNIESNIYFRDEITEDIEDRVRDIETYAMTDFPDAHVRFQAVHVTVVDQLDPLDTWVVLKSDPLSALT